jgi:Xaa-Pro aminopeptidase
MNATQPVLRRDTARVMAGVPAINNTFYRRIRFLVGDPAAVIELPREGGPGEAILILRDIEMERARRHAQADRVACPKDFAPDSGLSGDRETATAQAVAECLRRHGIRHAVADRTLPLLFAHEIHRAGIAVECDPDWGILDRRRKDAQEVECLREAQRATEGAIELACRMVARATARDDGVLLWEDEPLTADRVRAAVDVWLLQRGYANLPSIVAGGPQGADCHDYGSGELRTEQPVIIDIFPRNRRTLYYGDCTRTVVHGRISAELTRMHAAVVAAKAAAAAACRAGVTGETVHAATKQAIAEHGFAIGLPPADADESYCAITHGTGHGVGLDVHEPPLLDVGGPELVTGDAVTIEPGVYCRRIGGVRVEDMVIVTETGCENLNTLPEGLDWS